MTLEAGGVTLTFEIRPEEETTPRYELGILYLDENGANALDRIPLEVTNRRGATKELIERRLNEWARDRPSVHISQYAVLEIEVCRRGGTAETADELRYDSLAAPRHPSRLQAVDDDWEDLRYDHGASVRYNIGGQESRVYGIETGTIVGTSGSGRTYWIEVEGKRKRVPEDWIVEEVGEKRQ